MSRLFAAALIAVGLSASATPAAAEYVCGLNPYGDNFLSLRSGPGTGYPEITRLGPGAGLAVVRGSGGWLYVRTRYGAGWVAARYVC